MTLTDLKDDWGFVRYCHIVAYGRGSDKYRPNDETIAAARKLYKNDEDLIEDFDSFVGDWCGIKG